METHVRMCLILFAIDSHPALPLVVAANRDERYARPTQPLQWWADAPQLLAGKDLEAGGTWLGITRNGRFAAITNVREGVRREQWQRSRGELTRDFLLGDMTAADFADYAYAQSEHFAGFNLLLGDLTPGASLAADLAPQARGGVYYCSNRSQPPRRLPAGVYGLSNDSLDSAWPKVVSGKFALKQLLNAGTPSTDDLLQILTDTHQPADSELPDTGVGLLLERLLASAFIATDEYGTRASTALLVARDGRVDIAEQNFRSGGVAAELFRYHWQLESLTDG
ncbi:MAG: hypothetical protein JWM78_2526 [Verrucomicrobiaceae bacterium]|nr:hypothetical protein [Verrucomicrobiaceae bacterium]